MYLSDTGKGGVVREAKLRFCGGVLAWALLYYAAAWVSLTLDDPIGHLGFVWFPAAVAVSAFMYLDYRRWFALVVAFILTGIVIDLQLEHELLASSAISVFTLLGGMLIAWRVRSVATRSDDLQVIMHWILATFVITIPASLLGAVWISIFENLSVGATFGIWWGANVTGILFLTPVLMGLLGYRIGEISDNPKVHALGALALAAMCVAAWYIFDADRSDLAQMEAPWRSPLLFAMTGIPIILAVTTTVVSGNRLGSIALLALGVIVIYHSAEGRGPFFFGTMRQGGYLLLAQCYLVATALLVAFMRVFTQSVKRPGSGQALSADDLFIYRLHIADGRFEWDRKPGRELGIEAASLNRVATLLELAHPEDRDAMSARFAQGAMASATDPVCVFRLTLRDGGWLRLVDRRAAVIEEAQGAMLVGSWQLQK